MRQIIEQLVSDIRPHDTLEQQHITNTLAWIHSGAPLFRFIKPDVPAQHLVSYIVLVDQTRQKLLLVDHKKARLWLPAGGHVEPDEDPRHTVDRELHEELGLQASFLFGEPLFLTVTQTVGCVAPHTDVSLWYVLQGDASQAISFDRDEFQGIQWFDFDAIPFARSDPHLARFVAKLQSKMSLCYMQSLLGLTTGHGT